MEFAAKAFVLLAIMRLSNVNRMETICRKIADDPCFGQHQNIFCFQCARGAGSFGRVGLIPGFFAELGFTFVELFLVDLTPIDAGAVSPL